MIITQRTAKRLINAGKASKIGLVYDGYKTYMSIDRIDLQRVDHYFVGNGDLR